MLYVWECMPWNQHCFPLNLTVIWFPHFAFVSLLFQHSNPLPVLIFIIWQCGQNQTYFWQPFVFFLLLFKETNQSHQLFWFTESLGGFLLPFFDSVIYRLNCLCLFSSMFSLICFLDLCFISLSLHLLKLPFTVFLGLVRNNCVLQPPIQPSSQR